MTMTIDANLEAQYNARAAVPEHLDIQADWQRRSERVRASLDCTLDLAYGDSERQKIDFFSAGPADAPVHLYLHGGYWQRGDRSAYHFVAEGLCAHGVNVALAGYELCPAVTLDTIVAQTRAALAWLWRNAQSLGFDKQRIQVCGHSAGAHLTAMLMATDWPRQDAGLPADLIHSGIAISGLYALEPLRNTSINDAVGMDGETAARNSPALLPGIGDAPLIAAVGGLESVEFHRQAETLGRRWQNRVGGIQVLEVPATNHFTIVEALAREGLLLERALALLKVGRAPLSASLTS
jgi:arylformamidase